MKVMTPHVQVQLLKTVPEEAVPAGVLTMRAALGAGVDGKSEDVKPLEEVKSAEHAKPTEDAKPVADASPAEGAKPTEQTKLAGAPQAVEEAISTAEPPKVEAKPAEDTNPDGELQAVEEAAKPVGEAVSSEETKPAEGEIDNIEGTPPEESTAAQGLYPSAVVSGLSEETEPAEETNPSADVDPSAEKPAINWDARLKNVNPKDKKKKEKQARKKGSVLKPDEETLPTVEVTSAEH
jgi:hypothetical protein